MRYVEPECCNCRCLNPGRHLINFGEAVWKSIIYSKQYVAVYYENDKHKYRIQGFCNTCTVGKHILFVTDQRENCIGTAICCNTKRKENNHK